VLDRALLYAHIVGASGVLALGPFVLLRRSRRRDLLGYSQDTCKIGCDTKSRP